MKYSGVILFLVLNSSTYAISEKDANKFINNYESMYQGFLRLVNCITKAMTGSDAITMQDAEMNAKIREPSSEKPTIGACFSRMGVKLGGGVSSVKPGDVPSIDLKRGDPQRLSEPIDPAKLKESRRP